MKVRSELGIGKADAFVLSSRSKVLPMLILEAITAKLPVVATREGGRLDAVGNAAMLVRPKTAEE